MGCMRRSAALLPIMLLVMAPMASAQPAPAIETVIVTGSKYHYGVTPNAIAHDFVRTFTAPSLLLNEIARWHMGICPRTDGLSTAALNAYVTARIREVAAQVGAPLAPEPCKSNLEILFTDRPQEALDIVRSSSPSILGYHPSPIVSHAIQAWYMTGTTDINGKSVVDHDVSGTITYDDGQAFLNGPGGKAIAGKMSVDGIPGARIQGFKGRPEVTSDIMGELIIADRNKISALQLGPVANYVAMLALTRTQDFEDCQLMPSITNLFSADCDDKQKPAQVSPSDIAYLRGVYKMDSGATLQVQRDQIAAEMQKALGGQ